MKIEKMQAGRELDALIAEKVMGWEWRKTSLNDEQKVLVMGNYNPLDDSTDFWWGDDVMKLVPYYSRDIAAAWQVVEKMREEGLDIDITVRPKIEYGCRVAPRGECNTDNVVFLASTTAPLAICRAALKAVGECNG